MIRFLLGVCVISGNNTSTTSSTSTVSSTAPQDKDTTQLMMIISIIAGVHGLVLPWYVSYI